MRAERNCRKTTFLRPRCSAQSLLGNSWPAAIVCKTHGASRNCSQTAFYAYILLCQMLQMHLMQKSIFATQRNHGGCAKMFSNTVIIVAKMA